jgi:hypothetical protein
LFDLFIGRQIAPSRARFDDLPFLFADVVVRAPLFHLADEPRDLLLVVRRPRQYAAENCFYVILFHISDSNISPAFCTVLRGLPVIIQAANDLTAQAGNQASTTPANDNVHLPHLEITSVQFLKV